MLITHDKTGAYIELEGYRRLYIAPLLIEDGNGKTIYDYRARPELAISISPNDLESLLQVLSWTRGRDLILPNPNKREIMNPTLTFQGVEKVVSIPIAKGEDYFLKLEGSQQSVQRRRSYQDFLHMEAWH